MHAIGKGALIAEIQQNSNVTYRVYDYDRRGADGKPRELHVAKALDVAVPEPPKYDTQPMGQKENIDGGSRQLLARCPLFTVYHYAVSDTVQLAAGAESFQHILVTDGNGTIDGRLLQKRRQLPGACRVRQLCRQRSIRNACHLYLTENPATCIKSHCYGQDSNDLIFWR